MIRPAMVVVGGEMFREVEGDEDASRAQELGVRMFAGLPQDHSAETIGAREQSN